MLVEFNKDQVSGKGKEIKEGFREEVIPERNLKDKTGVFKDRSGILSRDIGRGKEMACGY